jgi:predicted phosphoribosyltransferase
MHHRLAQIAADGSQKLPVRILPTLRRERAAGRLPSGAARVLVAVPVGPAELEQRLRPMVDEVVVLVTPDPYLNVGQVYEQFPQVDDDEVLRRLQEGRASTPR